MNKEDLAYLMYNCWADTFFGSHSLRWEDLRQHEIHHWYEVAEELIPVIEFLQNKAAKDKALEEKYQAQRERAKAKAKERREAAKSRRQA